MNINKIFLFTRLIKKHFPDVNSDFLLMGKNKIFIKEEMYNKMENYF